MKSIEHVRPLGGFVGSTFGGCFEPKVRVPKVTGPHTLHNREGCGTWVQCCSLLYTAEDKPRSWLEVIQTGRLHASHNIPSASLSVMFCSRGQGGQTGWHSEQMRIDKPKARATPMISGNRYNHNDSDNNKHDGNCNRDSYHVLQSLSVGHKMKGAAIRIKTWDLIKWGRQRKERRIAIGPFCALLFAEKRQLPALGIRNG